MRHRKNLIEDCHKAIIKSNITMRGKLNHIFLLSFCTILIASCTKIIDELGNLVPKTVDQNSNLPSISVNNSMLHSEAYSHTDSTIIIFIHGGPEGDYRYLLNCKDLATNSLLFGCKPFPKMC